MRSRLLLSAILLLLVYLVGACSTPAPEPASEQSTATPDSAGELPATSEPPASAQPEIAPETNGPAVVASINGQSIERLDFERQVARFQAAMIGQGHSFSGEEGKEAAMQVRKQVLEAMIDQILIEQAAAQRGIVVSDSVLQQRIATDIEAGGGQEKFDKWLEMNGLTMEEYEQMMRSTIQTEEMIRQLGTEIPDNMPQVHVRQILVASEDQARDVMNQLNGGADFETLARTYSLDESSRAAGGDRGFVPLGTSILPPELEAVMKNLSAGEIAGPISSSYGYYIVQVVEIQHARALSAEMRQGLTQESFIDWIQGQRMEANIQRFVDLGG
jgi:parvulin-like peptidyl-prolyl isomerase